MCAQDWPSGNTEWQIFGAVSLENKISVFATTPDGAIDENLYCLHCGYNLRGLSGDPVRCPECGELNSLGVAAIPAKYIEKALRNMETTPTRCVAFSVSAGLFFTLALFGPRAPEIGICLAVGMMSLLVWWWLSWKTKSEFQAQPGWKHILVAFHVAAGFGVTEIFLVANAALTVQRHGLGASGIQMALPVIGIPLLIWSWRIYKPARDKLRSMQRETAIRIAKEMVHYAMRRHHGGTDGD